MSQPEFRFSKDIKLPNPPLAEAWLEIRWGLKPITPQNTMRDPDFESAWLKFFSAIEDRFPVREPLNTQVPEQILGHQLRYRFRPRKNHWPVLQIGPGIATLNYVDGYEWNAFLKDALYLRTNLLDAYGVSKLKFTDVILRYRNLEPFDPKSSDIRIFLRDRLHIQLDFPVPLSSEAQPPLPSVLEIKTEFRWNKPKSVIALYLATANRTDEKTKSREQFLLWDLVVASRGRDVPQIKFETQYLEWLNSAHDIVHDWFFSLVDGELRQKYEKGS